MTEDAHAGHFRGLRLGPGEAWAGGSSITYAVGNLFSGMAAVAVDPLVAPIYRLLVSLVISWIQVIRSRAGRYANPWSSAFMGWPIMAVLFLSGVGNAVGLLTYFIALQVGGVALTVPVLSTIILWSVLIAAAFLKEPLTKTMTMGVLVAVAGVALLGYGRTTGPEVALQALWAIPLAVVTSISWAAAANCNRFALTRGIDKYVVLGTCQAYGVLILTAVLVFVGRGVLLWTSPVDAIGVVVLSGLLSAVAAICDAHALSLTSVASFSTIYGTSSLISAILAVLFLGESLTGWMVVGTIATVGGAIAVQLARPEAEPF